MKKWMNRIGIALMAASAAAMIAGDAFAQESSSPFTPTSQKFYLEFTIFTPTGMQCKAEGPGVRTKLSRNIAGQPVLRVTGNAKGADISCWLPDGTRYTTDVNRQVKYNTAGAVYATVLFDRGRDDMSIELRRDNQDDRIISPVIPRAFVKVR